MPKTTKRAATKRAARIARAHATDLPKLEVKAAPTRRRAPGYKPPARGIARYPWGTVLTVLIIGLSIYTLYYYHVGPFAPKPVVKATPTPVAASPCLKIVSQLTDLSPAPSASVFKQTVHSYKQAPAMTIFHRVVPKFIIQTGDPLGNGTGSPGYKFADEPVKGNYTAGCVAMANSGANTNGSQFFICTADDTKTLQKQYNLFGHVVQGMNIVLKIQGPGDDAASKKITPDIIDHLIVVAAP